MSVLVDSKTRVIVQGLTGREGSFHAQKMLEYGTKITAGVSPNRGGTQWEGLPVFELVSQAVEETGADASIIFVPPPSAAESIMEAIEAGLELIVCITDGIPINDMLLIKQALFESKAVLIGPNGPGLITPGDCMMGIMPGHIYKKGPVGIVSRSGSLSYEVTYGLTCKEIGQSTVIGVGGDAVKGMGFVEALPLFYQDPQTDVIVLIGEIGGDDEERAAEVIAENPGKCVVCYIAGKTAPEGKKMGHAGALITGGMGTYASKHRALQEAGAVVAETPLQVAEIVYQSLSTQKEEEE